MISARLAPASTICRRSALCPHRQLPPKGPVRHLNIASVQHHPLQLSARAPTAMAAQARASGSAGGLQQALALVGTLSAVGAAAAVAKGWLTVPTALLFVALLGAALAIVRALAEPAAGGLPSWQQTLDLIRARRSLFAKDFTGAQLEKWQLETMLEAARWAPTHKKTEPWRFVVLGGAAKAEFEGLTMRLCRERLPADKAAATLAKLERKAGKDWKGVSCYIAICVQRHPEQLPEWEEIAAVACSVQNMYLAATAVGAAGYWSSWQEAARTAPEMNEFLGIGPADLCLGFFVAGAPDPERVGSYRAARRPLTEVVEWRL
ncbi:MAG: Nitroreductase-like protein [Monoraphidium minutum]|nr:MAG: Nitroreductase-like protein [Monoraphidium minutum]